MERRNSISYSADNVVIRGNGDAMELLLVQRKYPPFQGDWALPGGFIEECEAPMTASLRELAEETNLSLESSMAIPLKVRQAEMRDPRGRVITYPFLFWIGDRQVSIAAGDDARQAQWVKLTDLGPLAFDHGAIVCEALGKFWKQFPSFDQRLEQAILPSLFNKKKFSHSIYFGGSFNPWHQGHSECLKQCATELTNYDLVVVPDFNPWKGATPQLGSRCFFQRYLAMARDLQSASYSVYSGFWGSEEPNPTINWLPHTQDQLRGLLIGDDNFMKFGQWKDYAYILRSINVLYTVPRLFSRIDLEEQRLKLQAENPSLEITILNEHPHQQVSSTKIRES